MVYIWLNRYQIDKSNPLCDPYCSAAWRYQPAFLLNIADNEKEREWLKGLLDQHENFYPEKKADIKRLVVDMLNAWIGSLTS